ncbi:uncharacterized protein LOC116204791 [Punica granatum]|uniref:Uncharacterized protein LOC116204791 n=1 Tax=Punica granatum TaxID=22663 RepID=A0A218XIN7_PUNGR|nr:uncharacterized protein LOC116204791 [Punica granatum]XP_031392944.1 uncharacterized protein LOC116204791 [Punica granatum]OWM84668.1 hypothetical protein CDL15_Pgr027455 [Punica granatum]
MKQQQPLPHGSRQPEAEEVGGGGEFNPREWALRARTISRDNTISRRFSASNISRFREDDRSFRSNFTISSTASSPGYLLTDEIDPSTYSFTTALKALQARTGCVWECLSPEGFALSSKWNEAEKYICNPLSGEFPTDCLSAKTLSGRSLHNLTSRITMSAPLIYPSHLSTTHSLTMPASPPPTVPGKKLGVIMTRDVGIQSTPGEFSSGSASPTSTLSMAGTIRLKQLGEEAQESGKEVGEKEAAAGADDRKEEREQGREEKQRMGCKLGKDGTGCLSRIRNSRRQEKNKSRKMNTFLCSC